LNSFISILYQCILKSDSAYTLLQHVVSKLFVVLIDWFVIFNNIYINL